MNKDNNKRARQQYVMNVKDKYRMTRRGYCKMLGITENAFHKYKDGTNDVSDSVFNLAIIYENCHKARELMRNFYNIKDRRWTRKIKEQVKKQT